MCRGLSRHVAWGLCRCVNETVGSVNQTVCCATGTEDGDTEPPPTTSSAAEGRPPHPKQPPTPSAGPADLGDISTAIPIAPIRQMQQIRQQYVFNPSRLFEQQVQAYIRNVQSGIVAKDNPNFNWGAVAADVQQRILQQQLQSQAMNQQALNYVFGASMDKSRDLQQQVQVYLNDLQSTLFNNGMPREKLPTIEDTVIIPLEEIDIR